MDDTIVHDPAHYGPIHGDLSFENVLVAGGATIVIDFDDRAEVGLRTNWRWLSPLRLEGPLELRTKRHQMPPKPVLHARALGDEVIAVIEQQSDLHRLLVQIRDRELLDPVLDDRAGDRE